MADFATDSVTISCGHKNLRKPRNSVGANRIQGAFSGFKSSLNRMRLPNTTAVADFQDATSPEHRLLPFQGLGNPTSPYRSFSTTPPTPCRWNRIGDSIISTSIPDTLLSPGFDK